jgi:hypothetical protein
VDVIVDLFFVVDGWMNRLKSSFVHKMQNPRGHAPIVEVLEAAGVNICEKIMVRPSDVRSLSPTTSTAVVVVGTDTRTAGSTSAPSLTGSLATTDPASEVASNVGLLTSTNGKVIGLGYESPESEPPTPIIENEAEWMLRRSTSLTRIKRKKESRRKGGVT